MHPAPTPPPAAQRGPRIALAALTAAYAVAYTGLCWQRFATFHTGVDLSYYIRLVWGLCHGQYDLPLVNATNILGLHLEPILLPVALLHALGAPLVPLLFTLQALAAAFVTVPAFRLAARHLGTPWYGVLGAALALVFPTVTVATLHDFHPVTLALPLLLGVVDALDERRLRRALLLGALALCCREDIALQLACLAAAHATLLHGRPRALALALAAGLVAYFALYLFALQPRFVPPSGSYTLHFSPIGGVTIHSGADLFAAAVAHPGAFLGHLLSADRLLYPLVLLWPLGLLGVLAPRVLVGALPIFCINLLSDFPRVRTVEAHYATAIAPFVIGASLVGTGALLRWLARRHGPNAARHGRIALVGLLCATALAAHVWHGASPLAVYSLKWRNTGLAAPANASAIRAALAAVPEGASVAAHPNLLSHLAARPRAVWPPTYTDGRPVEQTIAIVPQNKIPPTN